MKSGSASRVDRAAQHVLVLLQGEILDEVADPPAACLRLPVAPLVGEGDLLDAGQDDGLEVLAHLDEDVFALAAVLPVEVHHGVSGGTAAGEEVQHAGLSVNTGNAETVFHSVDRFWKWKSLISTEHALEQSCPVFHGEVLRLVPPC